MRIRRSLIFVIQSLAETTIKKAPLAVITVVMIASGVLVAQNTISPKNATAITPPESCFNYTTNAGQVTIIDYYDNEGNDGSNPVCPRAVDIPGTLGGEPVVAIGNGYPGAFSMKSLTAVTIPNSIVSIGSGAFTDNQLTTLNIPDSVTNLGAYSFADNELINVTIPISVTSIGFQIFLNNKLTTVTIPSSVTSIGSQAFSNNQLTNLTIPSSVTVIGDGSFSNNQLSDITIPSSVTSLGSGAFIANKLTSIFIPSSVSNLNDFAFSNNLLTTVNIAGNPAILGSDILSSNPIATIIYNGTTYTDDSPDTDQCYDHTAGDITDYNQYDLLLIRDSGVACMQRNLIIPGTIDGELITGIADFAFRSNLLTGISMPNSITSIGQDAFSYNRLSSVTFPNGVVSIGQYAFAYNHLADINIPNSVTSIGNYAFFANSLSEVTIPAVVTTLAPFTFALQNPWGRDIEGNGNWETVPGVPYLYSDVPAEAQQAYDNIWYVRLYTSDPTNPNNIKDGVMSEWWWNSDGNANGTQADSLGGHIVNPARTTVGVLDRDGNPIQTSSQITGTRTAGGLLTDYKVTAAGAFAPLNPATPTPQEQTAMDAGFAQYHRVGQTQSFTAPTIEDYTHLSPASPTSTLLSVAENTVNFTYALTLGSIDFGTEGSTPSGVAPAMVGSVFAVDETKACSVIDSATLLSASGFTAPIGYTTLGGLDFTLECTTPGTEAAVSLTLGQALTNLTGVRVYKKTESGTTSDITSRVSIANENTSEGLRTVVRYGLADGGTLDDDGTVNGSISDPIYVVLPSDSTEGVALAATGMNVWMYVGAAIFLAVAGATALTAGRSKIASKK